MLESKDRWQIQDSGGVQDLTFAYEPAVMRVANVKSTPLMTDRRSCAVQQLIAILPWRNLEPSPAGAEETALIGKAQQIGCLAQRQMQTDEILVRQLAAGVVQQLD